MNELRTVGIWVFGLLASAIFGAMIAYHGLANSSSQDAGFFGFIAGACAFAAARLIFTSRH